MLYLTHALASLVVGLLFRFYGGSEKKRTPRSHPKPIQTVTIPTAFTGAVSRSLQSTLNICAFVLFFAVVLQLLSAYGVFAALARLLALAGFQPEWAQRLVAGLLELSSGVSSLRGTTQLAGRVSMAAFMLGWAGLSVHCQVLSFLVDSGLSAKTYLAGKLCHGLVAAGLTWCLTRLFPLSAPVADYLADQAESIAALDFSTALAASSLAALAGCGCTLCLTAAHDSSMLLHYTRYFAELLHLFRQRERHSTAKISQPARAAREDAASAVEKSSAAMDSACSAR